MIDCSIHPVHPLLKRFVSAYCIMRSHCRFPSFALPYKLSQNVVFVLFSPFYIA
jgi:hypothetical protein